MHEMSICLSLLKQVAEIAASHGSEQVEKIVVAVGPLSGVEASQLERAFTIARAGTVAAEAQLVTEPGELRIECLECGHQSLPEINRLVCSNCQSWKTRILSGYDLILKSVELLSSGSGTV